jgi:hypothetical protein
VIPAALLAAAVLFICRRGFLRPVLFLAFLLGACAGHQVSECKGPFMPLGLPATAPVVLQSAGPVAR